MVGFFFFFLKGKNESSNNGELTLLLRKDSHLLHVLNDEKKFSSLCEAVRHTHRHLTYLPQQSRELAGHGAYGWPVTHRELTSCGLGAGTFY